MAEAPTPSLGDLVARLTELRDQKRELTAVIKEIDQEYEALEQQVIDALDSEGTIQTKTRLATATIQESEVPSVVDWDAFFEYVRAHDALYLLERRVALRAWRELLESGETVPGTQPFVKRKLSLRKV